MRLSKRFRSRWNTIQPSSIISPSPISRLVCPSPRSPKKAQDVNLSWRKGYRITELREALVSCCMTLKTFPLHFPIVFHRTTLSYHRSICNLTSTSPPTTFRVPLVPQTGEKSILYPALRTAPPPHNRNHDLSNSCRHYRLPRCLRICSLLHHPPNTTRQVFVRV